MNILDNGLLEMILLSYMIHEFYLHDTENFREKALKLTLIDKQIESVNPMLFFF